LLKNASMVPSSSTPAATYDRAAASSATSAVQKTTLPGVPAASMSAWVLDRSHRARRARAAGLGASK
jgi:hypothetical protein